MTSVSDKSGKEKITESMEKIGAMLGVLPSTSNLAKDAGKEEPLIDNTFSEDQMLHQVNSAEGRVVGPPVIKSGDDSINTAFTTKPTTPGKTKTAVGAFFANIAAMVDNTTHKTSKTLKKVENMDVGCNDGDRGSDGSTITEYINIEKPRKKGVTPNWVYLLAFTGVGILLILIITASVPGTKLNRWFQDANDDILAQKDANMTIAFVGNSYLFVNDVPRVMESISKGKIAQQSVLNTAAGLGSLLKEGNGMYELWKESPNALDYWKSFDFKALMESANIQIDEEYGLRDYGYCTVPQLLDGFDNYLSYRDQNGVYLDVGTNPCFEDEYYLMIMQEKSYSDPMYFDYVILNDQTRRMVNEDGRQDTLMALAQAYAPLIKSSRAVPILIDTHAFGNAFEDFQDNSQYYDEDYQDAEDAKNYEEYAGMENYESYYQGAAAANINNENYVVRAAYFEDEIPKFTAAIYEGLYEYRDVLSQNLPARQQPIIAKIGLTYLAIYEDNLKMYAKLFAEDGIHASQHGTYLLACVLYCTIYGHLPMSVKDDFDVRAVFFRSRALFGNNTATTPTANDVQYLRMWARKVQVEGYVPRSMVFPEVDQNSTSYN